MKVTQNISRIKYLLKLFDLAPDELLSNINHGLKNPITEDELFAEKINLNYLKRIDKFFEKGLSFYLDPAIPIASKESSIFFRKQKFNTELNLASKKIVNHFEESKVSLSAIAKLADIPSKRFFSIYKITDNPLIVAQEIRKTLYPQFSNRLKDFLVSLISKMAEHNIMVFEFVEYWNQKEKTNIDGFYLQPNVIVLKRQQNSFRREIFTLIHELAHFLINIEEIESMEYLYQQVNNSSKVEKWCNDFAFHFLAGNYSKEIGKLEIATPGNDYQLPLIEKISAQTHLSRKAIYTRMLFDNKISQINYEKVINDFEEEYQLRKRDEEKKRAKEKELGIKKRGSSPLPINSPLLTSTIQIAFYEGILSEYDVCKWLNINPKKIGDYVS